LKRIDKLIASLKACINNGVNDANLDNMEKESTIAIDSFEIAMCDDLNTPRASAALFSLIGIAEKSIKDNRMSSLGASTVLDAINKIDKVFGILYEVPVSYFNNGSNILKDSGSSDEPLPLDQVPVNVKELAEKRIEYKLQKKFAEADSIRAELSELGYDVKDVKGGGYNVFYKSKV
jgi:cysteinyl-tRNA synthetase